MRCPRCYTPIPDEITNCVDCGLPRPKRAVTSETSAIVAEVDELTTAAIADATEEVRKVEAPKPIYAEKLQASKPQQKIRLSPARTTRMPNPRFKRLAILLGAPMLVSLLGAVVYLYLLPVFQSEKIEPQTAIMALTRLRRLPSNDAWLSVDERMMQEVARSRKEGKLIGYQGWTVRAIAGDKNKVMLVFTFDEQDGLRQRAEWLTDLVMNTYTPQTELAAAVFKR